MKKKPSLSRLKKQADKLWSVAIRFRDKACLVCGTTKNLQAHHAIIRKRKSNLTRWVLQNGITLCYRCHIIQLHRDADKDFLDIYIQKVNEAIPDAVQERLREEAQRPWAQPTRGELEEIIRALTLWLQGDTL